MEHKESGAGQALVPNTAANRRALAQQRQAAQVQQEDSGFAVPTFDFSGQINRLQRSLQLPKLPSMTGMIQKFERASGVDFKKMGKRMLYMIHTMTDETYAVNCTLELPQKEKEDTMFLVAFFSRCYWMIGSVLGGMLGQLIPWDMEGIDFCMTALFVIIFIDQWEKADRHTPALAGLGIGIICLIIFGASGFMLPALLLTSGLLVVLQKRKEEV